MFAFDINQSILPTLCRITSFVFSPSLLLCVVTENSRQAENRFIAGSEDRVNALNRAHYALWTSNYWLTNRVRLIGALVCGLVGGFLVASVSFAICFEILSSRVTIVDICSPLPFGDAGARSPFSF